MILGRRLTNYGGYEVEYYYWNSLESRIVRVWLTGGGPLLSFADYTVFDLSLGKSNTLMGKYLRGPLSALEVLALQSEG